MLASPEHMPITYPHSWMADLFHLTPGSPQDSEQSEDGKEKAEERKKHLDADSSPR